MSDLLPPRRTACDRCRSHKLRCLRNTNDGGPETCRRCFRAGVSCKTNAFAKIGRLSSTSQRTYERRHTKHLDVQTSTPASESVHHSEIQVPTPASSAVLDVRVDSGFGASGDTTRQNRNEDSLPLDLHTVPVTAVNKEGMSIVYHDPQNSNSLALEMPDPPTDKIIPLPMDPREECVTKLAELHSSLITDLNIARECQTADKCLAIISMPEFSENYNFLIGRMFSNSTKLVEVLQYFVRPSDSMQQQRVHCDKPTLFSIYSSYIYLIRIYRTILTCIHESIVNPPAAPEKLPPIFPGLHLGGYLLEPHLDLQVNILVLSCEKMLLRIDELMGLKTVGTSGLLQLAGVSSNVLVSMLEDELAEEHLDGILVGNRKGLPEILNSLKAAV